MNQKEKLKEDLKIMARGAYDLQKLRIQMGNRIVTNFKAKLGQKPSSKEEDTLGEEEKNIMKILRANYKKITDGVATFPQQKKFKGNEVISSYTELCLVHQYFDLLKSEESHFRRLGNVLEEFPIYVSFLKNINGVGPAMSAVIISEINIAKSKYASSIHKYAGLDVIINEDGIGEGRCKKAHHLEEVAYTDKHGEIKTKKSITFNPFLKTKLVGVLGACLIKAGKSRYAQVYRDYKHRLENCERHQDKSKGHRNNMAIRYMIKMFLIDLYKEWRALEGLEVHDPYHEAKLGLKHK